MDLKGKLKHGMRIVGADKTEYGTIERYDDEHVYVSGRAVPFAAFERLEKDRLYVGQEGSRYFESARAAGGVTDDDDIRVQVVEERLSVGKRQVELGDIEIRKTVESEQVSVPVEFMREQIDVRQVDVPDRPIAAGEMADAFKEGTIRVPIRGEEALVRKEAVVTGEVLVDRERVTEREIVSDTVRKERVTVDEDYDTRQAIVRDETLRPRANPKTSERVVEAANVETAQPVMRREGETADRGDSESWDQLRGDIRDASERTRLP